VVSLRLSPAALDDAIAAAFAQGWTTCAIPLDSVRWTVLWKGVGVPTRRDGPAIGILEPQTPEQAHPRSLSAKYGLAAFPLHTDGAHLERPPDLTILEAASETEIPTLLYDLGSARLPNDLEHALLNGVFSVGGGTSSFYAHAIDQHGLVRYDPGCMFPVDPTARAASAWLAEASASATEHYWKPGESLVIANRRCLHGRPDVTENPDRTLRRLMVHWTR
jgi:alpha-ketoglutarate-dependent taurine dioxygenase